MVVVLELCCSDTSASPILLDAQYSIGEKERAEEKERKRLYWRTIVAVMARPPSCCQLREEEAEGEKKTFHNSTFPNVNRMGKKEREIVLLLHWFGSAAVQISLVVFWGDCRRAWKIGADSIVHSMWYSRFICRAFFVKKKERRQ